MLSFFLFILILLVVVGIVIFKSFYVVPQQEVWIVETFGKYSRKLDAGLNFLFPFIESISAKHSLKERVVDLPKAVASSINLDQKEALDVIKETFGRFYSAEQNVGNQAEKNQNTKRKFVLHHKEFSKEKGRKNPHDFHDLNFRTST